MKRTRELGLQDFELLHSLLEDPEQKAFTPPLIERGDFRRESVF